MNKYVDIDYIYNDYTLNIFSDASTLINMNLSAYSSLVVCKDSCLDQLVYTTNDRTNNASELSGLLLSLWFATKYQNSGYKNINIFSDSKYAIDAIRDYMNYRLVSEYNVYTNTTTWNLCSSATGKVYENQRLIADCIYVYTELLKNPNINVQLLWQPSHIYDGNKIDKSINSYCKINKLNYTPSKPYIYYISKFNNIADNIANIYRVEMMYRKAEEKMYYKTPVHFRPINIDEYYKRRELDSINVLWSFKTNV